MKYNPVPINNLEVDTVLNFDIYIKHKDSFTLFRQKHHPFTEDVLYKLVEHKTDTVYVTEEGLIEFQKYSLSLKNDSSTYISEEGFAGPIFNKPENVEKYYETFFDYYPIEKQTLIPGTKVSFNVYEKKELEAELYLGTLSLNDISDTVPDDIAEFNSALVIQKKDIPLYKEYMQDITQKVSEQSVNSELRCSIVRENSKLVIKDVLENPRSGKNIKQSGEVVKTLIDAVLYNDDNFYNLLKINSYDYYTYAHSLNVCTLSIGLGIAINLGEKSDLMELGLGAVLHDLGKSLVDPRIINKPGRLTEKEFNEVKKHVVNGKMVLDKSHSQLPIKSYFPILQHHEKLSGKGYPYGLKGEKIHLFGRITAIVDFYDALTTKRPYKGASNPFETLQLISECLEDYDTELLKAFVMMLGHQVAKSKKQ